MAVEALLDRLDDHLLERGGVDDDAAAAEPLPAAAVDMNLLQFT